MRELSEERAAKLAEVAARPKVVSLDDKISRAFRAPLEFADQTIAEIRDPVAKKGDPLPWHKAAKLFRMRPSEVTFWAGANSSWKTMVMSHVAIDLSIRQKSRVIFASLEMPQGKQLRRIVQQATCDARPSDDDCKEFLEQAGDTFTLFDWNEEGALSVPQALKAMHYAANELGTQHFILDNISCVIPVGARDSDTLAQQFIVACAKLARRSGMHIHLVGHIRKPNEDKPPSRYEIRGTGSISDLVDNVVTFWRDTAKERKQQAGEPVDASRPDLVLTVDKQRHGDWEGTFGLWMDRRYLRFVGDAIEEVKPYWSR